MKEIYSEEAIAEIRPPETKNPFGQEVIAYPKRNPIHCDKCGAKESRLYKKSTFPYNVTIKYWKCAACGSK